MNRTLTAVVLLLSLSSLEGWSAHSGNGKYSAAISCFKALQSAYQNTQTTPSTGSFLNQDNQQDGLAESAIMIPGPSGNAGGAKNAVLVITADSIQQICLNNLKVNSNLCPSQPTSSANSGDLQYAWLIPPVIKPGSAISPAPSQPVLMMNQQRGLFQQMTLQSYQKLQSQQPANSGSLLDINQHYDREDSDTQNQLSVYLSSQIKQFTAAYKNSRKPNSQTGAAQMRSNLENVVESCGGHVGGLVHDEVVQAKIALGAGAGVKRFDSEGNAASVANPGAK